MQDKTMQHNAIQYNTINARRDNIIQYKTLQCNIVQYKTRQDNAIQHKIRQDKVRQDNAIQYNTA